MLSERLATQPGIDSQGMQRNILRRFRQFDFVNVDGLGAMPRQNFLSLGFLLGEMDAHPDEQSVRFRELLQPLYPLSLHPPTHR